MLAFFLWAYFFIIPLNDFHFAASRKLSSFLVFYCMNVLYLLAPTIYIRYFSSKLMPTVIELQWHCSEYSLLLMSLCSLDRYPKVRFLDNIVALFLISFFTFLFFFLVVWVILPIMFLDDQCYPCSTGWRRMTWTETQNLMHAKYILYH